ncbi:ABC transporter ATP-binding protein/permease, partial [Candidatus Bathyarchaeota archaeon]|nr:ABC transporter ATP-binding protein/permease [Candidatus Bathyarchaeota archaeon]
NVQLALLSVLIMPVTAYVANYLGKFSRGVNRKALMYTSGMMSNMQESLSGIKVIKSFVQEDKALRDFKESQEKVVSARIRAAIVSASYQPVVYAMRVIGTALVLWFGATLVGTGEITLGTFIAFTEYQLIFFNPLLQLATAYDQYQSAMAAIERMLDVIDTNPEVEDPPEDKAVKIGQIKEVTFEKVTFGYDSRNPVVRNINLSVNSNKKLAIVGPTGAGKSTIINLLSRFYDPLDGRISINGHDIRNIRMVELRSHLSIVLQDSFLFPMSIADNIRLGKPEATDEEIVEAAKTIGAHEFIMDLSQGYGFQIQEGSSNISIGQRQLISFARTILANPDLLILDEATSSVDPYTELVIQNALKKLLENRMTIIIAHRLSTVRLCDEIIVIDHGEIVERGTHSELMKINGLYTSFYRKQFKAEVGSTIDMATPSQ